MDLHELNVVVVGGATGGTVVALLLARGGARVTVLEKVDEPRAVGAGIAIAENGLTVLEALGLGAALSRVGRPIRGVRLVDGSGRELLRPKAPEPHALMLRRSELQGVLQEALGGESRVTLRLGTEVIHARPDGHVVARGGTEDTLPVADLVVGADGVHSRARMGGAFGARVSRPGFTYVRTLVGPGLARMEEAWTSEGLFGSFEVSDGTYVYGSTDGEAGRLLVARSDLGAWKEAWARAYPPAREILAGLSSWDEMLVNEVVRVDCERYFDGRLVLLGDAAHAMSPNVGQGANSAIVDAAVLAGCLRSAPDTASALVAYDARRRPAVRRVQDIAERFGRVASWTRGGARLVRDRLLMPLTALMSSERQIRTILQEPAEELRALCGG